MSSDDRGRRINAVLWGAFLIAVGGVFLYQRVTAEDIPSHLVRLWPLVLLMIGLGHMVKGKPGGGLSFLLLGGWFLACNFYWLGLTYRNSWPLTLVSLGAGTVVAAISGEDDRRGKKHKQDGGVS